VRELDERLLTQRVIEIYRSVIRPLGTTRTIEAPHAVS